MRVPPASHAWAMHAEIRPFCFNSGTWRRHKKIICGNFFANFSVVLAYDIHAWLEEGEKNGALNHLISPLIVWFVVLLWAFCCLMVLSGLVWKWQHFKLMAAQVYVCQIRLTVKAKHRFISWRRRRKSRKVIKNTRPGPTCFRFSMTIHLSRAGEDTLCVWIVFFSFK